MGAGAAAIQAGKAYVRLYTDSSEYVKGLRTAENKLKDFGSRIGSIGARFTAMATAAALPIALSAKTFADFQDVMLAVRAGANATTDEFKRLYDQAKLLGSTTAFSAQDVAGGQLSLARAGFNPAAIEAMIPSVLDLSRATGTELAMSTEIAAGSLRAFNLQAIEMPRVVDVLTAAANASDSTLEDLGESMKYAAPVAYQYGLSLEQTAKALGVLANLQIKGTMAGTSLRQIMLQLADPKIQKQLQGIGVTSVDAAGNMRPLGDVMIEIGKAMAQMPTAERLSLGKDLFDQRAVSAGLVLATQNFDDLSEAIDNSKGYASKTAKEMDSGLGGMLRLLKGAIDGVKIAIGEVLTETLTGWGTSAKEVAEATSKWIVENKRLVVMFTAVVAALGAAGVALVAFGAAASGAAAIAGLASMIATLHPVVLGIAAAVASAATAFALWGDQIKAELLPSLERIVEVWRDDMLPVLADLGTAFQKLIEYTKPMRDLVGTALIAELKKFADYAKLAADGLSLMVHAYERLRGIRPAAATAAVIPGVQAAGGIPDIPEFDRINAQNDAARNSPQAALAESKIKEAEKFRQRIMEEISKNRIKTIGDEADQAIAEINRRYDAELAKAKELGQSLAMVEEARKGALAAADAASQKKKDEEKEREAKRKKESAMSLADQIARQEIENRWSAQLPGDVANAKFRDEQKEKALLELERQQALRDAKANGEDPAQINKMFDMRYAGIELEAQARRMQQTPASFSTFSATDAYRTGLGSKSNDPQERTAKGVDSLVKNSDKQLSETKQLRQAVQSGLKMGP